jgi:hypothetical protein
MNCAIMGKMEIVEPSLHNLIVGQRLGFVGNIVG